LTTIKDRYQKHANENRLSIANASRDHIELERLKWYFGQETFISDLHLDKYDPVDVLKTMDQIARLVNRAATLFNQALKKNEIADQYEITDLCNKYVELSTNYLLWADDFQPSVATAFVQMASVPTLSSESDILKSVMHFFSECSQIPENQIYECISDLFAKEASLLNAEDDFVVALLMLRNAAFIHNSFKIKPNQEFNVAYVSSFDGVAASYLKVSRMAGLANNQVLSQTYLQRVYAMLHNNRDFLAAVPEQDSALPSMFHEILLLSEVREPLVSYGDKVNLLDKTLNLSERIGKAWYRSIDSAYLASCDGFFNQQLTVLDWMLNEDQYPDASLKLASIAGFLKKHADFHPDQNSPLYLHAKRLFEIYVQQSELLLKAGQPAVALEQLVLANQIGNWLPAGALQLIDNRTDSVAFPLIEQMVVKAKFYIWAMRLPEARQKLAEADSIEHLYLAGKNPKVTLLLASAHQELEERVCLKAQQKLDVTVNEIRAALQSRAFPAIENAFETVAGLKAAYSDCDLNETDLKMVEQTCLPIITYLDRNHKVKTLLFQHGYEAAIDQYVKLLQYVSVNKLDEFGISIPSLFSFVGEQNLSLLTITTIDYYVDQGNFKEALQYVWLAKKQNIKKSDLRHEMGEIAAGLAREDKISNIPVDEALDNYTGNDKWFSYFKIFYRKNRIL
jgi:hypothetical protein